MNETKKHLFLFTIGPVQSFIAQARKTQDLYAGSQILSALVKVGIKQIPDWSNQVIFPILDENDSNQSLPNRFIAVVQKPESELKQLGIDIKAIVKAEFKAIATQSLGNTTEPKDFDNQIERHLDIHWAFHPVGDDYKESYHEIESLLGSVKNVRAFEQFGSNGIGEAGRKCSLDGENNALFFGKGTSKNLFNSKWNPFATKLNAPNVTVNKNEGLSAVSFTKRFFKIKGTRKGFDSTTEIALLNSLETVGVEATGNFKNIFRGEALIELCKKEGSVKIEGKEWITSFNEQFYYEENLTEKYIPCKAQLKVAKEQHQLLRAVFKKDKVKFNKYYALIMFDGDKMGEKLSQITDPEQHKVFSRQLSRFAAAARSILKESGQTVYTGGDDFLGFVNLYYLFDVMVKFRDGFKSIVSDEAQNVLGLKGEFTFSAGIVIAHYKMPLAEVLKTVRTVEKKAKNDGNRNAFCITAMKHSGEIQETVFKWGDDNANWKALQYITKQLIDGVFSNKFITNLTVELYQLAGLELNKIGISNDAIFTEFKRLTKRALIEKSDKVTNENNIKLLVEKLELLYRNSRKTNEKTKNFIHALQIADFLSRKIN
jgi:CRISPR-associated protein Cmr2